MKVFLMALSVFPAAISGCKTNGVPASQASGAAAVMPVFAPGPQVLVYKTKADYRQLVPVTLSPDGKRVESYPHPRDLKAGEELQLPVPLQNGYFYDRRGIGLHTAFLNMTYAEYAQLSQPPTRNELRLMVLDANPITELCDCGNQSAFRNPETQLNQLIKLDRLRTVCRTLK